MVGLEPQSMQQVALNQSSVNGSASGAQAAQSSGARSDAARALVREDVAVIVRTVDELQQLRGKRLLLTGGTGFIGTWLLETITYLNDGWTSPCRVYVPTRDPQAFARKAPHLAGHPEILLLRGDVRSFEYPDERCDYIIHAAASASPLEKAHSPIDVGETIVAGTHHVLDLAVRYKVERCLILSSGAVYGVQPPDLERIDEEFRGGPPLDVAYSTYAEGKRYSEVLAVAYSEQHGVSASIARPFTALGAYQDLNAGFAVTDLVRDALQGHALRILGDGTTVRSYCAASEYIQALWGVLFRGRPGRAYNVGSDEPISVLHLARLVVAACGEPLEIEIARPITPGKLPDRYVPDITRLDRELGLRPQIPLDEALARYIAWVSRVESATDRATVASCEEHPEQSKEAGNV
jgi:dTDP-glucose 4,6-dehydratase